MTYLNKQYKYVVLFLFLTFSSLVFSQANKLEQSHQNRLWSQRSMNLVQITQKKLDKLKVDLNLNASQTSPWTEYYNFKLNQAKTMQDNWLEHMNHFEPEVNKHLTSLEVLDKKIEGNKKMTQHLGNRLQDLQEEKNLVSNLYLSLNEFQKTIFDLSFRQHNHFAHPMQAWMYK